MTDVAVDIRTSRDLRGAALDEWRRLGDLVHPPGRPRPAAAMAWAPREDTDVIVRVLEDSELRACAWVTRRTVLVDGREAPVAGIRGVMTHPAHRRRGYGRAAMLHAQAHIDWAADTELALLFSSVMGVPFYESLGWHVLRIPVYCNQPDGAIDYTAMRPEAPVMARPGSASRELPAREVDACGLPW